MQNTLHSALPALFLTVATIPGFIFRSQPVTAAPSDGLSFQAYLKASNPGIDDLFGRTAAISGDTVVVGAWSEDGGGKFADGKVSKTALDSGAAYVFVRSGTTWKAQAYLKAGNAELDDEFGRVVAISGDTLVVGAPMEDSDATGVNGNSLDNSSSNSGAAYVFVRNGQTWTQQAYLKASNTGLEDRFGSSVAIFGDTIVVGASLEDGGSTGVNGNEANDASPDAGAVYVFVRNAGVWTQQAYLKASNTGSGDLFGDAVAVANDTLVVGAPEEDSNSTGVNGSGDNNVAGNAGAAYVFVRSGSTWSQQAFLKASNTDEGDMFGNSLAIHGETVVCAATHENSGATGVGGNQLDNSSDNAGAVYVFKRNSTTWTQEAYVKASNTNANDQFGWNVAIQNDTLVIGARFEDSAATGVGGDESDNTAQDAGAAYVFERNAGIWSQTIYLKAHNTGANDRFGYGVGVEGDTIVVGALGEASNAKGVNGDATNNSIDAAGAAYIFDVSGTLFMQLKKGSLTDSTSNLKDKFQATANFKFNENASGNTLDPSSEGLFLKLGPEAAPIQVRISAGDPGWKGSPKAAPTKFTWKSPKGASPTVQVVVDTLKRTVDIKASNFNWSQPPVAPMGFTFEMGDDNGESTGAWVSKKPGSFTGP